MNKFMVLAIAYVLLGLSTIGCDCKTKCSAKCKIGECKSLKCCVDKTKQGCFICGCCR